VPRLVGESGRVSFTTVQNGCNGTRLIKGEERYNREERAVAARPSPLLGERGRKGGKQDIESVKWQLSQLTGTEGGILERRGGSDCCPHWQA